MNAISPSVLQAIGNTPLVALRRVVPPGCARIVVKVEGQNPTGSMKDRMAQSMVAGAERDGRLKPGGTIVEYTGGSTGASLALVAAAKGYRLKIVTSCVTTPASAAGSIRRTRSGAGVLTPPAPRSASRRRPR